jgi:hypothetical protein
VIDLAPQFDVQGKFVQRHVGLARLELEKGGFEYSDRPVKSGRSGGPLDPLDIPACAVAQRGESDDLESQAPAMGILEGSRSGAGSAGSMCTLHAKSATSGDPRRPKSAGHSVAPTFGDPRRLAASAGYTRDDSDRKRAGVREVDGAGHFSRAAAAR